MTNAQKNVTPIEVGDYVPEVVRRLIRRIYAEPYSKVALYGFGDNMKWLYRLMRENGRDPILCDWRSDFIKYDCGGKALVSVDSLNNDPETLLVICVEEINVLKAAIRYLVDHKADKLPTIYDRSEPHSPFHQEEPYKSIATKARNRARSMITDQQLFDLIQFIRLTTKVEGDVVEYGALHGGSGAILAEALNHFGKKPLYLVDSFEGIPKSRYGLDHRWNGAFSNNSYAEVRNAFRDCDNVKVVKGNICDVYDVTRNSISFGYLASDTMESGELLLNYMWPKLTRGGIIAICDYGSYPNCVPLTVMTDKFFEQKPDAFIYYPADYGIFIMKR